MCGLDLVSIASSRYLVWSHSGLTISCADKVRMIPWSASLETALVSHLNGRMNNRSRSGLDSLPCVAPYLITFRGHHLSSRDEVRMIPRSASPEIALISHLNGRMNNRSQSGLDNFLVLPPIWSCLGVHYLSSRDEVQMITWSSGSETALTSISIVECIIADSNQTLNYILSVWVLGPVCCESKDALILPPLKMNLEDGWFLEHFVFARSNIYVLDNIVVEDKNETNVLIRSKDLCFKHICVVFSWRSPSIWCEG